MITFCCLLTSNPANGQFKNYSFIGIQVDNDVYFDLDQYYSSGNFLHFGKGIVSDSNPNSLRLIHWTFGQQIFTPSTSLYKPEIGDYPYNGWLFIERQSIIFNKEISGRGWSFLLGVTGADLSLARPIHNFFHQVIRGIEKHSWTDPISPFFHLNGSRFWFRNISLGNRWKIHAKPMVDLGTYRTGGQIDLGIHYGSIPLNPYQFLSQKKNGFKLSVYLQGKFRYRWTEYGLTGKLFQFQNDGDWHLVHPHFTFEYGLSTTLASWRLFAVGIITTKDVKQQLDGQHFYLQLGLIKAFF
ncbi:MAG: DUF2219 family protein [Flavobacteriaceae bacterium]|nr:DUF2219 family protein [Flavobacteriaceae bacterium]